MYYELKQYYMYKLTYVFTAFIMLIYKLLLSTFNSF